MVTASVPRVYGLDAICAAALQAGGEESAQFARRLYSRLSDKDLAASPCCPSYSSWAGLLMGDVCASARWCCRSSLPFFSCRCRWRFEVCPNTDLFLTCGRFQPSCAINPHGSR